MKNIYKFIKSLLFISIWLIITSYLLNYWNIFHWEFIYLPLRSIFDREVWYVLERNLFNFDIGYWIEEALRLLSYEIPKECFKYLPIYLFLKFTWIKK